MASSLYRRLTEPAIQTLADYNSNASGHSGYHTPPHRNASPFNPPPLTPLTLLPHWRSSVHSHTLLTRTLAEEIRLLVPPRLQLVSDWHLAYSVERDGSSLATLYQKLDIYSGKRSGFVLAVKDAQSGSGGTVFGAYLTDVPRPSPHYYGTGECFLWKASVLPSTPMLTLSGASGGSVNDLLELAGLPLPPSEDTTNLGRVSTLGGEKRSGHSGGAESDVNANGGDDGEVDLLQVPMNGTGGSRSGASTPERLRFKAFPYSGMNDYMMFCEQGFLSVGGGDGHYGLWLDSSFEKGISSSCPTFGNEPLSEDGTKFDVLGVEVWYIGS